MADQYTMAKPNGMSGSLMGQSGFPRHPLTVADTGGRGSQGLIPGNAPAGGMATPSAQAGPLRTGGQMQPPTIAQPGSQAGPLRPGGAMQPGGHVIPPGNPFGVMPPGGGQMRPAPGNGYLDYLRGHVPGFNGRGGGEQQFSNAQPMGDGDPLAELVRHLTAQYSYRR